MPFTRGHALLIGIGSYRNASYLNVPQTGRDATALAAVLQDERYCGYPAAQTQPLLQGDKATANGILQALEGLAKRAEPADTVLIFYAGHGQQGTDGNYYLTTHDTEIIGMEVKAGTGIPIGTFLKKVSDIAAERLLFLCNACYSGRIPPELLPNATTQPFVTPPLPKDAGEALLSTGKGRVLITACGEGQESQTGTGDITLFTQAVIRSPERVWGRQSRWVYQRLRPLPTRPRPGQGRSTGDGQTAGAGADHYQGKRVFVNQKSRQ